LPKQTYLSRPPGLTCILEIAPIRKEAGKARRGVETTCFPLIDIGHLQTLPERPQGHRSSLWLCLAEQDSIGD